MAMLFALLHSPGNVVGSFETAAAASNAGYDSLLLIVEYDNPDGAKPIICLYLVLISVICRPVGRLPIILKKSVEHRLGALLLIAGSYFIFKENMPHQEYRQNPDQARPLSLHSQILVGPTAVGKTSVAHLLAERRGARIVSADSMLVYRGMDIGTAKPSHEELRRFDYVGVDIVAPDSDFNLARYLDHVRARLASHAEMPLIVVGGTGLYVKALTRGLDDVGVPDPDLRAAAEKLLEREGIAALREYAARHAPAAYARLKDKDNPRRLVRALESRADAAPGWEQRATARIVGLRMEREALARRIAERVDRMYAEGLLDETAALLATNRLSRTARQAIGYREAIAVLNGEMDWPQAREQICLRTRRLAKSQMTWFRNQEQVDWIDVEEYEDAQAVAARVEELWEINGTSRIRF